MAGEIQHAHSATGVTLYAVIRNVTGQVWNTTLGPAAFETQVNINWGNGEYDIVMTETPVGGYFYIGDLPAVDMDKITISIHLKAGGIFAVSNPIVGSFAQFMWSGAVASSPDANVTFVDGDAVSLATEFESDLIKIHGTALTETGGQLAGGFTKFFDVGSPTGTLLSLPDVVAGLNGGLLIAGSNAATTFATLTVSGATSLQALGMTTFTASGAMSAASLTLSGTLQAATIVSTGTTTFNALTVTGAISAATLSISGAATFNSLIVSTTTTLSGAVSLGSTLDVTGTTTLAAISQTGTVGLGATTIASMAVTGALTAGSADFTTVIPVNAIQINGSTLAAQVLAAKNYEYQDDAVVLVADGATDTVRGTNLATAYTAAKSLTPGGNALSASNRAAVLIPKAHYRRTATLDLDTDFVDLIAIEPEMGGHRMPTDADDFVGPTDLATFRPPPTLIYSDTDSVTVIEQSCQDIRAIGFGVAQLSATATGDFSAFYISGDDNAGSYYNQMYFWHRSPIYGPYERYPVGFAKHVMGVWADCIANGIAWRVGYDATDAGQFSPTMFNLEAGALSFIGDYPIGHEGTHKATDCFLNNCRGVGKIVGKSYDSGYGCFAGCTSWSMDIENTCWFIDCASGSNSGSLGAKNEGNWIRFQGKENCLGGTTNESYSAEFAGYAEDCHCGAGSFGGRAVGIGAYGSLTGTLNRCTCEDSTLPWRVEGATINDCLLTVGTNDVDCITLLDSLSRIHNSTLLVVEGGTGIPINAASALNVSAIGNRYNNVGAAATGLGSNVTNVGTGDVKAEIVNYNLDHLALTATAGADMTNELADNTILSRILANGNTSDFVPSTDGLQPIRDQGDSAWVTATDVNVTQINGALTDGSPAVGSRPRLYLQQLRAECNIAGEGALHCTNASNSGIGQKNDSFIGQQNSSVSGVGQYNVSVSGEAGLKISGFDADILLAGTGTIEDGAGNLVSVNTAEINGSALAAQVLAAKNYEYQDDAVVLVADGATDAARGTNLGTAYTAAKSLTPGGNALSASNRAAVLIPKAHYDVAGNTLDLDTEFVDLIALNPQMGGRRMPTDYDNFTGTTAISNFRPPQTLVFSSTNDTTVVEQSAQNVRTRGFGVAQLSDDTSGSYHAFYVSADDNEGSCYDTMYFWHSAIRNPSGDYRHPVGFSKHVKGIWQNCIANGGAWHIGYDAANASQFSATMYDCEAGAYSFIGDYPSGSQGTHKATQCRLVNCKSIGGCAQGDGFGSFAGCGSWGNDIDSTCVFVDCEAGNRSFGLGGVCDGEFYRCKGGDNCFGGTAQAGYFGEFAGYAENCIAGKNSFGGDSTEYALSKLTGELLRCKSTGSYRPWRIEGATIEDCLLTMGTTDQDCITLLDSLSRINNSTILVVEAGTGVPINAASALNVSAIGNRYNNESVAADGLGDNVTNVGTGDVPTDWTDGERLDLLLDATLADTNELQTDWTDGGRLDLILDDVPNTAEFEARTILADEYFVVTDYTAPDNTSIAAILDDTGTSGVLLSDAENIYHADVFLTRDTTNKRDEYTVHWYLNGIPITSGITVPTIQVVKRSDGTDLISTTALTQIGTTGAYKLDTTTRLTSGEAALAVVVATIGGSLRTWRRTVGRDI